MVRVVMSEDERVRAHPLYAGLVASIGLERAAALAALIADELALEPEFILQVAGAVTGGTAPSPRELNAALLSDEFSAFLAAGHDGADEANFKTRSVTLNPGSNDEVEQALAKVFESIILVDRLREVRAAVSFSRYRPDAASVPSVTDQHNEATWLPATEGYGEGIFLQLSSAVLNAWSSNSSVQARAGLLAANAAKSRFSARLHTCTPAYIAIHSLAHALMREFAFSSGYTAASLRERIYSDDYGNHGVFIYTTSSDEEGTLGGLVREGEHDRIGNNLARAVEQLDWCSNDPVCAESNPHNLDGLNLAACHSCLLASETSCSSSNLLLDRLLLVGGGGIPGMFSQPLHAIQTSDWLA